ncbi:uridine kinase family protein [Anaerocolumna xylanovorans]|uniref:Uridine kinase n=1 Tax=Anaerocolumna xylanovorans DSM 12503 TaxID=1121345 RepID=A0A1M7YCD4_9FIRM|nr:AAA family ATPase [Anaerocolumna xylanovorans]SHO50285.1 uridine kinase [Anaerocolumna xylanovorans DSM 12503]
MKKTYVVGIAGGSASGKSTFCSQLEKKLEGSLIRVFHMDDYFKEPENRPVSEAPVTGILYLDDNHPDTMDLLRMQEDVEAAITEEKYQVVLVEGLLTLWKKELYKLLNLKLFVDCQADERIVRRLRRNMSWGLNFEEVSKVYLDLVRYRHEEYVEPSKWKADLILNGSNPSDTALEMVVRQIQEHIC